MTPEQIAALRKPFEQRTIGKLPKPTRRDAPKGRCPECAGWHGLPAIHVDYVGHAAVTDRLLEVDPEWTWEPVAVDDLGLPALDRERNLWIRLTVGGVTRLGVGDGDSMKERIGDALRNAAMRFGVALDLWTKEELESSEHQPHTGAGTDPATGAEDYDADAAVAEADAAGDLDDLRTAYQAHNVGAAPQAVKDHYAARAAALGGGGK